MKTPNRKKQERLELLRKAKAAFKNGTPIDIPVISKQAIPIKTSPIYRPYSDKCLDYFVSPQKSKPVVSKGVRQTSLGERTIADWLVKNGIKFRREKQFVNLINPTTGQRLWLDFYLHSHKIVIEFDGKQHYKASKMFDRNGDSLESRIHRDKIKDHYCLTNGLKMVRIRYNQLNEVPIILSSIFEKGKL